MKCEITFSEENASTIEWISDEYKIKDLKTFIFSIHCDGGEEIEELYGVDFKEISFNNFKSIDGDDENTIKLLYSCIFEFDEEKFISFKNALDNSSNHVEIKVGFKDKSGKELDHEDLYEGYSDIPTEVTILWIEVNKLNY